MRRVSRALARGIVVASVLLTGGRVGEVSPSPLQKTLAYLRTQDFTPVFDVARERVEAHFSAQKERAVLEALFGLSGKWKALTRGKDSYRRYVARTFEKCVLDPVELGRLSEAIRQDWAYMVLSTENRLLGVIDRDLRPFRPELTGMALRERLDGLQADFLPSVLRDLGMNAVSFAGADAAASLLASAVASAAPAGEAVAGAAVAGGPWTFGASLAVGLVVALVIDETAGAAYEDVARTQIHLEVNDLRNRLIDQVFEALARAVRSYLRLQEESVRALYEGRPDDRLARRR